MNKIVNILIKILDVLVIITWLKYIDNFKLLLILWLVLVIIIVVFLLHLLDDGGFIEGML
jgi:hypothetical protein